MNSALVVICGLLPVQDTISRQETPAPWVPALVRPSGPAFDCTAPPDESACGARRIGRLDPESRKVPPYMAAGQQSQGQSSGGIR